MPQPFCKPGIHFRMTRTIDVGLRVGWGLAGEAASLASGAFIAIQCCPTSAGDQSAVSEWMTASDASRPE